MSRMNTDLCQLSDKNGHNHSYPVYTRLWTRMDITILLGKDMNGHNHYCRRGREKQKEKKPGIQPAFSIYVPIGHLLCIPVFKDKNEYAHSIRRHIYTRKR